MMPTDRQTINFYGAANEYGQFSNFAAFPILIDGQFWPTTEHYFQAQKYAGVDTDRMRAIRRCSSPGRAAQMGRDRKYAIRRDWERVKEQVMLAALRAKFSQHQELKHLLVSTGDAWLVEHTELDRYWGDGGDGSGQNRLGHLLMLVRSELQNGAADE